MVKRADDDRVFPGSWELPGGGIDYGETAEESLIREIKEECGLNIDVFNPLAINNFYIDIVQYFEVTFLCRVKDDSYKIILSNEHSEYKWIRFGELSELNTDKYMQKTLRDCENNLK